MSLPTRLAETLASGASADPAILAPGAPVLTFGALRAQIEETASALHHVGIGRGDRVAIVLTNGPEMATLFLAIASVAASAPLNPAYRVEEFEFYLTDLRAKALVVQSGSSSASVEAARKLALPVIFLEPRPADGAGRFRLDLGELPAAEACVPGPAEANDIALVLHTSGTTSRPKIVPLTQRNLAASASHIVATLDLTARDRGLVVMPLFHIHGLIAGVLAPLAAGGSIFVPAGFNALKFFGWLKDSAANWWTAVPSIHQAILARAEHNEETIRVQKLRFIRSSSAALPVRVLEQLERVFRVPVIEAYGMTEAAHQMASNQLPPGLRKPGGVGVAAGPRMAIMDALGNLLPPGETGEVVIQGPNVTPGYENNPEANAQAFVKGWFRTGDQGVMDGEGHFRLTGRLKEIISRGGEKISPYEVDEALLSHPDVEQAVTFAIPHEILGEEVGAVVMLREGATATERTLREFVARRLADFKVPSRILFVGEIPKGATGKTQRIGLADKLGLGGA